MASASFGWGGYEENHDQNKDIEGIRKVINSKKSEEIEKEQ